MCLCRWNLKIIVFYEYERYCLLQNNVFDEIRNLASLGLDPRFPAFTCVPLWPRTPHRRLAILLQFYLQNTAVAYLVRPESS